MKLKQKAKALQKKAKKALAKIKALLSKREASIVLATTLIVTITYLAVTSLFTLAPAPTIPNTDIEVQPIYPSEDLVSQKTVAVSFKIPKNRVVLLGGEVNERSQSIAAEIATLGLSSKDPIYLLINSPGGSVLDGSQIVQAIQGSQAPVYTVCIQICASMAAIIFSYGQKRYIADQAMLMYHPASGGAQGELDKMVSQLLHFQRFIGEMEYQVATRANISFAEYKALSGVELWLTAKRSVDTKFADEVVKLAGAAPYQEALNFRGSRNKKKISDREKIDIYMAQ